jgi:hypothetical protein
MQKCLFYLLVKINHFIRMIYLSARVYLLSCPDQGSRLCQHMSSGWAIFVPHRALTFVTHQALTFLKVYIEINDMRIQHF